MGEKKKLKRQRQKRKNKSTPQRSQADNHQREKDIEASAVHGEAKSLDSLLTFESIQHQGASTVFSPKDD